MAYNKNEWHHITKIKECKVFEALLKTLVKLHINLNVS